MATKGVQKRGERHGDGVEKRPAGEAERDAAAAEDRLPLFADTKEPVEPGQGGVLERPDTGLRNDNPQRRGLSQSADPDTDDRTP